MGVVYKAEDLSLHRFVALKFLPVHTLADDVARERFKREARATAALDHPNICHVYEIGEHEGRSFIVMAFLEGESLSDKVRRGPLVIEEAVGIAAQIAEGLDHAHQRGVIHRDIKSANIFITTEGRVKIIDLGLARRIDVSTLTDAGTRLGTVSYMSPEQARGDSIDGRSDIWSLGVVLYEMLAGKLPFAGSAFEAVVYSILHVDPRPVTEARPEVSADRGLRRPGARHRQGDEQGSGRALPGRRRVSGRSHRSGRSGIRRDDADAPACQAAAEAEAVDPHGRRARSGGGGGCCCGAGLFSVREHPVS